MRAFASRDRVAKVDQRIKIVIIDDDEAVRSGIGRLLRSLGFSALDFPSAEGFLSSDEGMSASCVLTDIRMPGMSGIELQGELNSRGLRIPIIFMTAYAEEKTRALAMGAGARGFLTKPFAERALIECINAAVQPT